MHFEKVTTNELSLGKKDPHMYVVASLVDHEKISSCYNEPEEFCKAQLCLLSFIASYKFPISSYAVTKQILKNVPFCDY